MPVGSTFRPPTPRSRPLSSPRKGRAGSNPPPSLPGPTLGRVARGGAMLKRSTIGESLQSNRALTKEEKKAVNLLRKPRQLTSPQNARYAEFLSRPNQKVQRVIDSDPTLKTAHNLLTQRPHDYAQHTSADIKQLSKISQLTGHSKAQALFGAQEAKLRADPEVLAHELIGIGPGLVRQGIRTYHHPIGATEEMGKAIVHSFGQTLHHPGRQAKTDPLGFLANVTAPFFAGAGTIARGSELGATAKALATREALPTGEKSVLRSVGKTLMRPQQMERTLRSGGHEIHPPAFKSALGGYLQRVQDSLINRRLASTAKPLKTEIPGLGSGAEFGRPLSAEAKFARQTRRQTEHQAKTLGGFATRLQSPAVGPTAPAMIRNLLSRKAPVGALRKSQREGRSAEEILKAPFSQPLKRMTRQTQKELEAYAAHLRGGGTASATHMLHNQLYHTGMSFDEAVQHGIIDAEGNTVHGGVVALKPPPEELPKAKGFITESKTAGYYDRMKADRKYMINNPDKVRFIPSSEWRNLQPHRPGRGVAENAARTVDKLTQVIRSGRFAHPGYFGWALQNGIIHSTQAGLFAFRNAWQLHHEFSKLSDPAKGMLESAAGAGVARATSGEIGAEMAEGAHFGPITRGLEKFRHGAERFWHHVDDRVFRLMSVIHELNHAGLHTHQQWEDLAKRYQAGDPAAQKLMNRVTQTGSKEAIDYGEMTPAERDTMRRMFTAWGWTRGASTWSARFPLQHPIQGRIAAEEGRQGKQTVEDIYAKAGGMVPSYLRGTLPLGHAGKVLGLETELFNPAETPGRMIEAIPGLGKHGEPLGSEIAPGPALGIGWLTGKNRYGTDYQGNRFTGPVKDMLKRIEPVGAIAQITRKTPGTIQPGLGTALSRWTGLPVERFSDINKTAALGEKDWEKALSRGEQINFRHDQRIQKIPEEVAQIRKKGITVPHHLIGAYKGDLDAIKIRDQFQLAYAHGHGSRSYRSLPAQNKMASALAFLTTHSHIPPETIKVLEAQSHQLTDDKELESLASAAWQMTGIGQYKAAWDSIVKSTKPPKLTKPQ